MDIDKANQNQQTEEKQRHMGRQFYAKQRIAFIKSK